MSHLLTEGELSRLETASKFGGMAGRAALIYGAGIGIAQPFVVAALHFKDVGKAGLSDGEFVTLAIGFVLAGAALVEWFRGVSIETVPKICDEYRK